MRIRPIRLTITDLVRVTVASTFIVSYRLCYGLCDPT